jgi:hypothetical protein
MQPDNFDKQFREVLTNKHFAYDPAAWEQARALLDQQQRKKRLLWWFWPIVGILLLGWAGAVQYNQRMLSVNTTAAIQKRNSIAPVVEQGRKPLDLTEQVADSFLTAKEAIPEAPPRDTKSTPTAYYRTKKGFSVSALHTTNAAVSVAATHKSDELPEEYMFMESKKPKSLQPKLFPTSIQPREIAETAPSFEREVASNRTTSVGLHAFGGMAVGSPEAKRQFNYGGGLFVEVRKNKLYLALEPAVHAVQGVGGFSNRSDTSYAFGQIIKTQHLAWNNMLLVQLPLVIGFEVLPKHTLGLGLVAQQYLQSSYTLTETTINQGFPVTEAHKSGGQARVSSLVVPQVYGLIRYQYQVSPAFSLGLQYNLTPFSEQFPVQSQIQFQLKYHLFNRQK